ncbi:hypothetical protein BGZ57DRAFT_936044 [Hyaloscypha finlandica]|nr:hypothetical protein BGZ57DRAFT_936044 [Hyaloscypha finlandica]
MSGFEVVGLLLGLYPIVVDAVNVYKATKTGRAATSLIRKLKIEEVIYHQFVYKLLASNVQGDDMYRLDLNKEPPDLSRWQAVALNQKLRIRLPSETADLVLEILREMETLLKDLNAELSSISRGMEILDKFRTSLRVAKYSRPQSSFQQRLSQLSKLNKDLNRLLDGDDTHLPSSRSSKGDSKAPQFLVRDYREVIELYEFIRREGYDCECDNPHVTNFGLHCPAHLALVALPDFKSHKWDFELVLPPSRGRESTQSGLSVLEESGTTNYDDSSNQRQPSEENDSSSFRDICSFVRNMSTDKPESDECLGIIGKTNRRYKLSSKPERRDVSMNTINLEELMKLNSTFLRKDRMQLALWLSCSILQFYYTGWIDTSWTSKDFCVLNVKDEQHDEISQLIRLFVTRSFYSARLSTSKPTLQTVNNLWSWYDEPILTKLGFALIELAFCCKLSELRNDKLRERLDEENSDLLDLQTATDILDSGRLAREESPVYEDVVRACIKHQYLGKSSSGPKGLDSRDISFFDRAEESIIGPLFAEFAKTWGPN